MLAHFLLYVALSSSAKDTPVHPIDKVLNNCLAATQATMQRAECYNKAYIAWENDIAATEKKLIKKHKQQDSTINADQQLWEKERDAEFSKIANRYNKMRGTMYIPLRIKLRMEVLRQRAIALEKQLAN